MAHPPFFPHHRRAYCRNAASCAFLPIFHRLCSFFFKKYAEKCSLKIGLYLIINYTVLAEKKDYLRASLSLFLIGEFQIP
jgi:hypothetical protein